VSKENVDEWCDTVAIVRHSDILGPSDPRPFGLDYVHQFLWLLIRSFLTY